MNGLVSNEDYSAKYYAEKSKELAESIGDPANRDLSNLTSKGQNIANWSTNVTNCITEISQDIKLELNNGTLTLKAGSKLYIPNGFESDGVTKKFDVITTEKDISYSAVYTAAVKCYAVYNYSAKTFAIISLTDNRISYNSTTNKVIHTEIASALSFPLALVVRDTTGICSVEQVFNGFGYIGSTVFSLPGVKGLIPNGRNADGSLKNIEFTLDRVLINTLPDNVSRPNKMFLYPSCFYNWGSDNKNVQYYRTRPAQAPVTYCTAYIEDENKWIRSLASTTWEVELTEVDVVDLNLNNSVITSFTPKTPFHAVDYNDFSGLDSNVVHKTGNETISGEKTFTNCIRKTTSTNWENIISMTGNNFPYIAGFSNSSETALALCTLRNGYFKNIEIHNDGTTGYITAPASDVNGSILTTHAKSKAENGFFQLGNGLIIQWGRSNQRTFTYPIPFSSDTSFSIVVNNQAGTNGYGRPDSVDSLTRTSCMVTSLAEYPVRWIAIGY